MKKICLLIVFIPIFLISCDKDDDDNDMVIEECEDTTTYNDDIKPIMEQKCATPACHGGGQSPGDFRELNVVQQYIDAGLLEQRVLIQMNMPPSGGTQLTDAEKAAFECWVEGGYLID